MSKGFMILSLLLMVLACTSDPQPFKMIREFPAAENNKTDILDKKITNLFNNHLFMGYVVAKDEYNILPIHLGDSALFTGLAIASIDEFNPNPVLDHIIEMGGLIERHPIHPKISDPSSRDQVIGMMYGLVVRWNRKPEEREKIAKAWKFHYEYVENLKGKLYPKAGIDKSLNPSLYYLWLEVGKYFGITEKSGDRNLWLAGMMATAIDINVHKKAAYPLHLSMLQILTAHEIGKPIDNIYRWRWCQESKNMLIPMIDWYCERRKAENFLANYVENEWDYQHQRAQQYESPDGNNNKSSQLDFIILHRLSTHAIIK